MYLCLLYNIFKLTRAFLFAIFLKRYFELGRWYYFIWTESRILFSSCLPYIHVTLDLVLKISLPHLSTEASAYGQKCGHIVWQLPVAFTLQWMGIKALLKEIIFSYHSPHQWLSPLDLLEFVLICVTWRHLGYDKLYSVSISNPWIRWGRFNES
jgi:hypothetical protein